MAKPFHLTIARVGENLFDGEAVSVTLPGAEGQFTVLASHEPFVSELAEGEIIITPAGAEKRSLAVVRGVAEVSNNQVTVLL